MSTKTTLKRIALVAVSTMGFGLLSVVPSNATAVAGIIDSISVSAIAPRVGETASITATLTDNGAALVDGTDDVVLGAKFLTDGGKPASSSSTLGITVGGGSSAAGTDSDTIQLDSGQDVRFSGCSTAVLCSTVKIDGAVSFTPDVAGSYKVMVWVDSTADGAYNAGEVSGTVTLTTAGKPASVVLTKLSPGNPAITSTSFTKGALYSVTVKDAAGVQTKLTADEALTLTSSISTTIFKGAATGGSTITALGNTDIQKSGIYYFRAVSTAAADSTPTITVTATGGEIASGVTAVTTTTFKLVDEAATTATISDGTATNTYDLAGTLATDSFDVARLSAVSLRLVGDTADEVIGTQITDTYGDLTGYYGAVYTSSATTAATTYYATLSFGGANLAGGHTWDALLRSASTSATLTATAKVRSATATGAATTISPSSVRAAKGGALSFTGVTLDQFGQEFAGASISWSVGGANTVASTTKISDADGVTSFSYTPAVSGTDTVAATGATSRTVTVVDALTVGTVLLTTPHTDSLGVTEAVPTYSDINAGVAGASGTTFSVVATVKDASAVAMAGVPVTFTISGTGAAVTSTTKTVYTGSTGTATAKVYGWVAGTYTVTATAGTVSDTAPVNFAQTTELEARTISAVASGSIVTATVKDRYGNGVYNAPVYATRTGAGNFAGASKANGTTDRNGQIEFIVSGGSADVTVSVGTAVDYGQTDALKGLVSTVTSTDVFDPAVAGTALADEEGVGVTYDAAGNNSAKVTVDAVDAAAAAADAAAEATDAANAATDAANAAAEAADAATAAAQDAADAVAALSTQVTEMVNALKKQITALTNLVIKIQKKVKA
jgi:hypothetical protein